MTHVDLAIIGSGSGNSVVGPALDDWQVAVVEESTFGGTCLNVGCIPTKMFVYPADIAAAVADLARLGVDATLHRARWADIRDRIFGRIDPISAGGRDYRAHGEPNTALYEAHATFTGPGELALSTGETLTADRVVIATGSRPEIPEVIASSGIAFHTSETVMRIDELPQRAVILGGGYIAAEFAHVFSTFGVETTIVCRSSPLLRHLDLQVAETFTDLAAKRWRLHLDRLVAAARPSGAGFTLELDDGQTVAGDLLLVATGRRPNSDRLGLDAAGVAVHPDGRIVVDDQQRTTAANVWALGDVCSEHQLKHVANHEARVVAHNVAHPDAPNTADHRFVPSAVFTHPQLATVGLTEQDAISQGRSYVTAIESYSGVAYGWAMEDTTGLCKLLADPSTGQLLGAHIMGEQAATLIQPLIQAMSTGLTVAEMAHGQYWIHPALTEVVENALLSLPVANRQ
jgi:mycothione reductase